MGHEVRTECVLLFPSLRPANHVWSARWSGSALLIFHPREAFIARGPLYVSLPKYVWRECVMLSPNDLPGVQSAFLPLHQWIITCGVRGNSRCETSFRFNKRLAH